MAVRVKVGVTWKSKAKTFIVLVNGGAESDEPVIVLRPEDAEELGLSPNSFDIIEVELASGKTHNLTYIPHPGLIFWYFSFSPFSTHLPFGGS